MSAVERNPETISEGERRKRRPTVTIIGSFKFKDRIDGIINILEEKGIDVLAPPKGQVSRTMSNFPLLEGDFVQTERDAWKIELNFLENMINSDLIYLVNPGGYQGIGVSFEMGYAQAHGVPIFAMETPLDLDEPDDPVFIDMSQGIRIIKPEELLETAKEEMEKNKRGTFAINKHTFKSYRIK